MLRNLGSKMVKGWRLKLMACHVVEKMREFDLTFNLLRILVQFCIQDWLDRTQLTEADLLVISEFDVPKEHIETLDKNGNPNDRAPGARAPL